VTSELLVSYFLGKCWN